MRRDRQRKADGQIEGWTDGLTALYISIEKIFLWQFSVADNNKTHVGLHINCPSVKEFGIFRRISTKVPNINSQGRTDRYDKGNRRLSRLFELA
jgi:hypothetical protein